MAAQRNNAYGWKDIATVLGVSVRTAQRWEKRAGLPVLRLPAHRRGQVMAVVQDLEAWREKQPTASPAGLTEPAGRPPIGESVRVVAPTCTVAGGDRAWPRVVAQAGRAVREGVRAVVLALAMRGAVRTL